MAVHQRIAGGQRFKFVGCGNERLPGQVSQRFGNANRVFRMGIQTGTHGGTAQRQLTDMRDTGFNVLQIMRQHGCPAGNLLAEGQRGRILQMGTANFDDIAVGLCLIAQSFMQHFQFGDQVLTHRDHRGHVHRGWEHVIGTLAFVDVVVRMHSTLFATDPAQQLTGTVGQHLIHIHVGLGAGAGLPNRQGELIGMLIRQHFIGGADNGIGTLGRQ
ncbi:hypothetical protein D3C73_770830 [compost metagenome]